MTPDEAVEACKLAANRLHHLSMVYVGALIEVVSGEPVGVVPDTRPGLAQMRDLIDLLLYTRAEISGLSRLLVDNGVFTTQQYQEQMAEEYNWFANVKAKQFGCTVTDVGLSWNVGQQPKFRDLAEAGYSEDQRIEQIGQVAMGGKHVAFMVEDDSGKAERYIAKLLKHFPSVHVVDQHKGPTKGVVTVTVARKETE